MLSCTSPCTVLCRYEASFTLGAVFAHAERGGRNCVWARPSGFSTRRRTNAS